MPDHTPSSRDLSLPAAFFTVFLCMLFGANAVAIKISLAGLGPFTTATIRFSISSLAISLWAWATGRPFAFRRDKIADMLFVAVLFTAQLSLFYVGLSKTNASRGTLIANLQPFFTLFLAHLFIPSDRITARKLIGILMGFSGIAFVFLEKKGISAEFRSGDLIMLCATFLWALSAVYVKRIIDDFRPFQLVFYPIVLSIPVFAVEALLWDQRMVIHLDATIVGAVLYQSIVTAAFGFVAWNSLLQRYGAVALHSFLFIMPISGVVLGGLVLHEPITPRILLALGFIVTGILTVHYRPEWRIWPFFLYRG